MSHETKSFEEKLDRLEELNNALKEGCSLEKALKIFTEGISLSRNLEKELESIERKVEILVNEPVVKETAIDQAVTDSEKPILELFNDLSD